MDDYYRGYSAAIIDITTFVLKCLDSYIKTYPKKEQQKLKPIALTPVKQKPILKPINKL